MTAKSLSILLVLIGLSSMLCAQQIGTNSSGKWELSLLGGVSTASNKSSTVVVDGIETPRTVGISYASGYMAGIRITENLGQHVGAELAYMYANHPLGFTNLQPALPRLDLDHKIHSLVYSILLYARKPTERFRPFLSVGGGTSFFRTDSTSKTEAVASGISLTDRWKLDFSVGGGVKFRLSDKWGIRFDATDVISGVPDYGLPPTAPSLLSPAFRPDGFVHNWKFSSGLSYYFKGL